MMAQIFKLCSVFDHAAQVFARPFPVVAGGQAIRDFTDEVNRVADDNPLYKHPDDYTLYVIGTFDDSTGFIDALGTPEQLVRGKDCVKS